MSVPQVATSTLSAALVAAALLGCPRAHAQECNDTGSGFRLLTYNVQMLENPADPGGNEATYGVGWTHEGRAKLIADDLRDHGPDVIVLNEVNLDEARDVFVDMLSKEYPYFVSYIGNSDFQDSGLMLFSRYAFVELPKDTWVGLDTVDAEADGNDWESVAFADFDDASEQFAVDECLAHEALCAIDDDTPGSSHPDSGMSKGAGLVRLRQPCTDELFYVVFTHMQADYGDDDDDAYANRVYNRGFQLETIRTLIYDTIGNVDNNRIYIAGDLNVDGNPNHPEVSELTTPLTEWEYHFDSATSYNHGEHGFFACGDQPCPSTASFFVDTWAFHTSPDDLGRTEGDGFVFPYGSSGKRFDYILRTEPRNDMGPAVCSQWLRIAWPVAGPDGFHSDHLPVEGYFNDPTPFCSARTARPVTFNALGNNTHADDITVPGGFEWHRIDSEGTYAISVEENTAGIEVYAADDLSRPMAPTVTQIDLEPVWDFKAPPYYIKVFPVTNQGLYNPAGTTPYTLDVHKHSCTSEFDACFIHASTPKTLIWPNGYNSPVQSLYFWFSTELASNGALPVNTFISTEDPAMRWTDFEPHVTQANPPYTEIPMALSSSDDRVVGELEGLIGNSDGPRRYLLRVDRTGFSLAGNTTLEWRTNLTYLNVDYLHNIEESDDDFCCDEVWFRTLIDVGDTMEGVPLEVTNSPGYRFFAEMDEGQKLPATPMGLDDNGERLRFVGDIRISLADEDGEGDDDNFNHSSSNTNNSNYILALNGFEAAGITEDHHWAESADHGDSDYHYLLRYHRSYEAE